MRRPTLWLWELFYLRSKFGTWTQKIVIQLLSWVTSMSLNSPKNLSLTSKKEDLSLILPQFLKTLTLTQWWQFHWTHSNVSICLVVQLIKLSEFGILMNLPAKLLIATSIPTKYRLFAGTALMNKPSSRVAMTVASTYAMCVPKKDHWATNLTVKSAKILRRFNGTLRLSIIS